VSESIFFRVLDDPDRGAVLAGSVEDIRRAATDFRRFAVDAASFHQVPGSPFAYWVDESIRELFTVYLHFESDGRMAKQGLATASDFRFVRAWWEVTAERTLCAQPGSVPSAFRQKTFEGQCWVPFAKGGEYSPYYADPHLVGGPVGIAQGHDTSEPDLISRGGIGRLGTAREQPGDLSNPPLDRLQLGCPLDRVGLIRAIDDKGVVRYHGYIEDHPNEARAKTRGLRNALDAVLAGGTPPAVETKAFGCTIRQPRAGSQP